jgi:uncharacterized transporter YbjL
LTYEGIFLAMIVVTLGVMWVGIRIAGVGGGITGFLIGAVLAGFVFSAAGVETPEGCSRYSSFADDC